MPTCTHMNYHQEAQRKARFLQRKQAALVRLKEQQEEEERKLYEEMQIKAQLQQEQEENRRREREEHLRQRGQKGGQKFSKLDKEVQVKMLTQKDLRHQSKVLRDHGLVMGHVNDRFHS